MNGGAKVQLFFDICKSVTHFCAILLRVFVQFCYAFSLLIDEHFCGVLFGILEAFHSVFLRVQRYQKIGKLQNIFTIISIFYIILQ